MRQLLLLSILFTGLQVAAQSGELYGLSRNNEPAELFLSNISTPAGTDTLLGSTLYDSLLIVTGTTLNAYENTYLVLSNDIIFSIDITNGDILSSVDVNLPIENAYIRSLVFNPSDSNYYGIVIQSDTLGAAILFASIDVVSGDVTILSDATLTNFLMPGRNIIDPYQMVYYMFSDTQLLGIDLYTGDILTQPIIENPYGVQFDNISFNCKDGLIYGLIPATDTALVYLGTIDPTTGVVSLALEAPIDSTYFISGIASSNSAIDPVTNAYFYIAGENIKAVDISTGVTVFSKSIYDAAGRYFGLFHHYQDCYGAQRTRFATSINTPVVADGLQVNPNPAVNAVQLVHANAIDMIEVYNATGQLIKVIQGNSNTIVLSLEDVTPGMYFITGSDIYGNIIHSNFIKN